MRKWPAIDIVNLWVNVNENEWNKFVDGCINRRDVITLQKTYYGLQAGMDDLSKNKLNDNKMSLFFLKLARRVEAAAKIIYRYKFPSPLDNPLNTMKIAGALESKRARDRAFAKFLKGSRY